MRFYIADMNGATYIQWDDLSYVSYKYTRENTLRNYDRHFDNLRNLRKFTIQDTLSNEEVNYKFMKKFLEAQLESL